MTHETNDLSKLLAPEFTDELAKTRKALERVPNARGAFTPDSKSRTLFDLCNHLVSVSGLGGTILMVDGIDFGGPSDSRPVAREANCAGILRVFDELASSSVKSLETISDADLLTAWQATAGGHVLFSGTRYQAFRTFSLNHLIHHRAQLGLYLRLLDIPVPATFGPSADEQ